MSKLRSLVTAACIIMFVTTTGAQEITSFKGLGGEEFYQDNIKISGRKMDNLMAESPVTNMYWHRKKSQMLIGLIATTANIGSGVWWIVNSGDHKNIAAPVAATAGTFILAAIYNLAGNRNKRKAILEYNETHSKKTGFSIEPAGDGLGLTMKF